ncbi:mitochondrial membrane protein [Diaporthe amygdali]|uniref:mitochondrial membrane protein n=1 Tax=Phomopsis amygdali TaxID=1214568 RepID=UPI0022FE4500|nr:mitochondrial membrane protein [Diaporthe amygdali]KAJ0114733.1 mitochondrial membrane protein [Diaporthe amygdali]
MLPLRLRGSRGIRTRYVCASCCAHVSQGTGAHGREAALSRTYATKKTASETADDSAPAQPSQADKPGSRKAQTAKAKKGEKPAGRQKKKTPSPPKASKEKAAAAADASNKPDETVQLWKETLDILKSLQETQEPVQGTTGEAATKGKDGKKNDANTKRSLKSHFPPIQGAPSKAAERQAKLLEGTLDVLKNVLTVQADQRTKASKTVKNKGSSDPTTKPERKQTVNKGAKADGKIPPGVRSGTVEASVAQGFAALVEKTRAEKKAAAREGGSKFNNLGTGQPEFKNLTKADNVGHVGWGKSKTHRDIKKIKTRNQGLEPVDVDKAPVPRVQYGLDRVLFNEGVYVLQDPRTRVYNFDPYLATIMPVDQFDFDALKQYVTSSKDTTLIDVAKKHNKKFTGSTSSMTATLSHFHYLLSSWRPINDERISNGYIPDSVNFGAILRAPAATFLHYKNGTYAIDADKEYDSETILSMLGKSMEKLLTAPKEEFEKYRRSNSHQLTEEERNAEESYHYTTFGNFMMRSQLDAQDPRLPGTGVFDLKTRAVVTIRMDAKNPEKGVGYEIRQRQGQWQSFEREYYDMIRLAFLKYSLQVRMGRMDGIFVAYHNTQRIFGFQYIPLEEMDLSLHGSTDMTTGNREFMASLELLEELLQKATERFPEKSLRIHVETRPSKAVPFMYFFAEPVNDDEIKVIQEQNKEEAAKFQERVLGIKPKDEAAQEELDETEEALAGEVDSAEDAVLKENIVEEARETDEDVQENDEEDSEDVWEDMMEVVEQTMESDAQGISAIRDAIEDALEQSGLLHAKSSEEAEQYVEALLKAIVDVNAERPKTDDEAVPEISGEQQEAQDVRPPEQTNNINPEASSPQAAKPSRFGFLSSWFGVGNKEADTTAKQEPTKQDQDDRTPSEQNLASRDDAPDAAATENKAADGKPDDILKDLLVKLTTRIGSSSDSQKATEELSEDQAKLRNFESILLEMMPRTQESPTEAAEEGDEASDADEALEDTPASSVGEESTTKPVMGMILTIRNKVNNEYVRRPEKLKPTDKWAVEYTAEEIPEDKVQDLYSAMKKRRYSAYYKEPGRDLFKTMFDGKLAHYSRLGERFRQEETKLAQTQPLHVVGQDPPSGYVYMRKPGPGKPHHNPLAIRMLEARGMTPLAPPVNWDSQPTKEDMGGGTEVEKEPVEAAKEKSASFREWRERDQQRQDREKEPEKDS